MRTPSSIHGSALAVALAIGCSFDPGGGRGNTVGLGEDDGDSAAALESDGGSTAVTSGLHSHDSTGDSSPPSTGMLEGVEPGSEGASVETGEVATGTTGPFVLEGTGVGESTGVIPECPRTKLQLLWAEDAVVIEPMRLAETDANGAPLAAVSAIEEEGTVTFTATFDCPGTYRVWGLVWDYNPGGYAEDDPDSLYVGIGEDELVWRYGCQTEEAPSGLSWQPLQALLAQPCEVSSTQLVVDAPAEIEITFRNREAGYDSNVAGIAALLIADEASRPDPYDSYTP